jgi:arylsulfatase
MRNIVRTLVLSFTLVAASSALAQDGNRIPAPFPPFEGEIGKTYQESEPAWPALPAPPEGAPNIVVILLDDVGFGQPSTFGGLIPTGTIRIERCGV